MFSSFFVVPVHYSIKFRPGQEQKQKLFCDVGKNAVVNIKGVCYNEKKESFMHPERKYDMNFSELIFARQSCRKYDPNRPVEEEKLSAVLEAARLAPSACNGQPYRLTVCRGEAAKAAAGMVTGMGMNKFAADAPILIVISEAPYVATAALGAKVKHNDYRSMDIGIAAAYLTAQAADLGLGSCMLGWFDDEKLRNLCSLDSPVRLVITLGYPATEDSLRPKKRKSLDELAKEIQKA